MKNILLMILVSSIPFMSIAQKRSKKGNNAIMDKTVKKSPSEYEYLLIDGVQQIMADEEKITGEEEKYMAERSTDYKMSKIIKNKNKLFVTFKTGVITAEIIELNKLNRVCSHMSDAIYHATKFGWDFVSASHTSNDEFISHFIYMKRKKNK